MTIRFDVKRQTGLLMLYVIFMPIGLISQDSSAVPSYLLLDSTLVDTSVTSDDSLDYEKPDSSFFYSDTGLPDDTTVFRKVENKAFQVGEHLVFEVAYGPLKAGIATMSIPDTQRVEGRACYHIVTTAKSNKFVSTFFKVRDRVESFVDVQGLFPWKFEKHIREGNYKKDRYVRYDQRRHLIHRKKGTLETTPYIQGILSAFYYCRTQPLEVGKHLDIECYGDGKIYNLRVLVHKKERIRVPAGRFQCIVVEPKLKGEGLFKQKGRLVIWLTDDEKRMPVLMKSKALIGSISTRLIQYRLTPDKPKKK